MSQLILFNLLLSGTGGCMKSHLMKTVFHPVNKIFQNKSGDPGKPRVLLHAPTGVRAMNIDGATIH